MLRETSADRGCFGGCLFTILIGGVIGSLLGWLTAGWYSAHFSQNPQDESLLLLKFMAAVICFIVGAVLGGAAGFLIAKKKEKDEIEEEVL